MSSDQQGGGSRHLQSSTAATTAVHYLVQTRDRQRAEATSWLTPGEQATLAALTVPKRRADWLLGRWTAKQALAGLLHLDDHFLRLEIRAAADGAPEAFIDDAPASVAISLSHSADHAICSIAGPGTKLGCDLELIEARSEGFIETFFTTEEQRLCAAADATQLPLLATLIWSAKESALKAMRQGLRLDTRSVEVRPDMATDQPWRPLEVQCAGTDQALRGWWRQHDRFVLCIVTDPQTGAGHLTNLTEFPDAPA